MLQIPSQPIPDDSQPTQLSAAAQPFVPAQPISRPKKRHASTALIVGISNFFFYYKYICVISNCFVLHMQPASTNSSCVSQAGKPTTAHVRQKTLGLKSDAVKPTRRSSRLLATFKEPNLKNDKPTVDLTSDAGQPATAPAVVTREPVRASRVVIREPARKSTRVVLPTVEKCLQRMEAKNKGKRPIWQP